jgi:hypothetical protein
MITEKLIHKFEQEARRRTPQHVNRISSIGFPCERMLCYSILRWEDKKLPTPELIAIFNEGNIQERAIKYDLQSVGVEVQESQAEVAYPEYRLYGHIDGIIAYRRKRFPVDFKSMSTHIFDKMNTTDDFMNSEHGYHRCYVPQLQMYMYGKGLKTGMLIIKNKNTGWIKEIEVKADKALCKELLRKCSRINIRVDAAQKLLSDVYQIKEIADFKKQKDRDDYDTIRNEACKRIDSLLPERINENGICTSCPFEHICLPDEIRTERARVCINNGLETQLREREQVKENRDRYEELDKTVKGIIKESKMDYFICGDFEVRVSNGKNTRINIERI